MGLGAVWQPKQKRLPGWHCLASVFLNILHSFHPIPSFQPALWIPAVRWALGDKDVGDSLPLLQSSPFRAHHWPERGSEGGMCYFAGTRACSRGPEEGGSSSARS